MSKKIRKRIELEKEISPLKLNPIYEYTYTEFIRRYSRQANINIYDASKRIRDCVFSAGKYINIPVSDIISILFSSDRNIDILDLSEQKTIEMF